MDFNEISFINFFPLKTCFPVDKIIKNTLEKANKKAFIKPLFNFKRKTKFKLFLQKFYKFIAFIN